MTHKKFQHYRPINWFLSPLSSFTLYYNWNWPKIWFGHKFWLEGLIDLRPTRLNCILHDLFRDTPLDHRSIGPPIRSYNQISFLPDFPHCNHCVWDDQMGTKGRHYKKSTFSFWHYPNFFPPARNLDNFSQQETVFFVLFKTEWKWKKDKDKDNDKDNKRREHWGDL